MFLIELPICIAVLKFCMTDATSSIIDVYSVDVLDGPIAINDLSTYYYYDASTESSETTIQNFLDDSTAKCLLQRNADDLAKFLTYFAEHLSDATIFKLNRVDDKLASVESDEKKNTSSQVKGLKKTVTEKATKAHCPTPDDPSLMGEFDAMIDLVYEMCFSDSTGKAEKMRWEILQRVNMLVQRIESVISSGFDDFNRVCFRVIEESKEVLENVEKMIESEYEPELRLVYSTCFKIAYEHAEKFMPSVVQRATSCRTTNWNRMNPSMRYTNRSTMNQDFV